MKQLHAILLCGALVACDDVTPVSIELVFAESGPFESIETFVFSATDNNTNTITQSFQADERKLELPVIPYGEGWVFSVEGRFDGTPLAFGQSVPVDLNSQEEVSVKIFFGQINAFHLAPSQPSAPLMPLLLSGLPPLPVDVCARSGRPASFIGGDLPQSFDAGQLLFSDSEASMARLGSSCVSFGDNSLLIGGVLDATAAEFSQELGLVDSVLPDSQRMISPNLARVGHQSNVFVVPAGETSTLPDGTTLAEGTSLVLVTGGKNNQQTFTQVSILIVTPSQEVSLYEPGNINKKIFISPRVAHSATLIQNDNKTKLLIAGGLNDAGVALNSTECIDLETFAVTQGPLMSEARAGHSAITTKNGDVILIGGQNAQQESTASIERFSPRFNGFVTEPLMLFTRRGHSATLLDNGLILIAGGIGKRVGTLDEEQPLSSGELFNSEDALQGGTLFTRDLHSPRAGHAAVSLSNGAVLLVGGAEGTPNAELYIPVPGGQ
jgi:hypothetical protein